ncbi:histone-lysine N-methyltransferase ash1 isoform X2 [Chrysoperla carnea]|uniref:histone-lysine N-methyltransferase ash1 isoform X2 n=1 Tax=Chrysoperla carnea TaxID=189513 RepID=UPI001D0852CB|nr:histone-lysine N-methyltransferase ash1 isoform X2 [Chrysoperla carnea]
MAVNEPGSASGGGVTDLLSGWSFVVHRPSEDPEPSSLPSTVDITAFSSGPSEHQEPPTNDCQPCSDSDSDSDTDNSGSEGSGSCSGTSSDSESSSSSQCSSPESSPSFNLTSMQTGGLKLKIAVRKSPDRIETNDVERPVESTTNINADERVSTTDRSSGSNSACTDSDSDTESQSTTTKSDVSERKETTPNSTRKSRDLNKSATKNNKINNNDGKTNKNDARPSRKTSKPLAKRRRVRVHSQGRSKGGGESSSDESDHKDGEESESDANSAMLAASCSLQEIRQEDLAAILPDQQECDAFGGFECESRTGKGTLINETDNSDSDMELSPQYVNAAIQRATEIASDTETCPSTQPMLYANSLLQQFEAQTQMLSTPTQNPQLKEIGSSCPIVPPSSKEDKTDSSSTVIDYNTKRKRGRPRKLIKQETTETIISKPTNTSQERKPSTKIITETETGSTHSNVQEYTTEPNVSPDSGIQESPEHASSPPPSPIPSKSIKVEESKTETKTKEQKTVEKPKVPISRHSFDRMIYANADRVLYPPRRKVGRPPTKSVARRPGRPPKIKTKQATPETENIQPNIPNKTISKDTKSHLKLDKAQKNCKDNGKIKNRNKLSEKDLLKLDSLSIGKIISDKSKDKDESCDNKMKKRLELSSNIVPTMNNNKVVLGRKKMNNFIKSVTYPIHSKHRHHHKHHKNRHHRILVQHRAEKKTSIDPKIVNEIDKLVTDFIKYCNIGSNRLFNNKVPEIFKCVKRVSKKRKGSDNVDGRKKKKQCNVNNVTSGSEGKDPNSNEQRLPLKKRHYHVSSNGPENISTSSVDSFKAADSSDVDLLSTKQIKSDPSEPVTPTIPKNLSSVLPNSNTSSIVPKATNNCPEVVVKSEQDIHIQEAIEACIHKYTTPTSSSGTASSNDVEQDTNKTDPVNLSGHLKGITATTPKKRHKLEAEPLSTTIEKENNETKTVKNLNISLENIKQENLNNNTEMLPEKDLKIPLVQCDEHNIKSKKASKLLETVAQIKTRKKNRLEDLTSNLVSKITPATEALDSLLINNQRKSGKKIDVSTKKNSSPVHRATVIKSPPTRKLKLTNTENLAELDANIVSDKPTGIFLPTIDIELHIPASTIRTTSGDQNTNENKPAEKFVDAHNLRQKKCDDSKVVQNLSSDGKKKKDKEKDKDKTAKMEEKDKVKDKNAKVDVKEKITIKIDEKTKVKEKLSPKIDEKNKIKEAKIEEKNKIKEAKIDERNKIKEAKIEEKNKLKESKMDEKNKIKESKLDEKNKIKESKIDEKNKIKDSKIDEKNKNKDSKIDEKIKLKEAKSEEKNKIKEAKIDEKNKVKESKIDEKIKTKEKIVDEKNDTQIDEKVKEKLLVPVIKKESNEIQKKRTRRRKAINRTGFPTVKKKKKKILPIVTSTEVVKSVSEISENVYDRIPRIDEMASNFLERTLGKQKTEIKNEKESNETPSSTNEDNIHHVIPEKEIIESTQETTTILNGTELRPKRQATQKVELKRKRERSTDSVSDKRKRERSLDSVSDKNSTISNHKRRTLRDLSPASSIEPLPSDKRIRPDDTTSASGDDIKKSKKPPRWRKKYLIAGLFSDYYKEDESSKSEQPIINNKTKLVYLREEHPHGLLPPPYHCGKYLRTRKQHFQLPYDIWWQHTHSKLPNREAVPSWNYRKIRTNVYCVRPTTGACEPQPCNCSESSGCGDDCINRLVLAECPATHRCKNQRIQKHDWAPGLDKFMTEDKGWGVRTKLPIKAGEFILEYVGEVVSDQEFKQRMASRYAYDTHHYCLHLDGGLVIDGHRMGGDGRFVNHSCQPNCEMQKWSVNGQFRMALFALRDIHPFEELTYDYNFSLFNPAEGQTCKCNSGICRGVIGGKSQRVKRETIVNARSNTPQEVKGENGNGSGRVGRPRKNQARRTTTGSKDSASDKTTCPIISASTGAAAILPQMRPLTNQQKTFIAERHCFLLKNIEKVRKIRDRSASLVSRSSSQVLENSNIGSAFINHLNALRQPRNIRTRRLAQAEGDPELTKTARLAEIFRELLSSVTSAKDEKNESLSAPFMTLPSKRKVPDYYTKITDPIDLSIIEQNIDNGLYRTVELFDNDMNRLIDNAVKFYHRTSELGIAATRLRKVYGEAKLQCLNKLQEILGEKPYASFVTTQNPGEEEEDVIRCICGLYRDEGLMIQCERCLVWQHCECVKADVNAPSYHCERCQPRDVEYEIPLDEYTEHGHRYYLSLMRGDLQLRQGDTVYVLRDIPIEGTDKKHTYETIGDIEFTELDIFRIERLWKDKETGKRMAYGHHYLRPHETYHEPTRKFFPNEVMRVPLYEAVPVELIMSRCWVLDINTYCKGRPIGAPEEHIYICEYRVDKSARLFSKVSNKSHYPICTKSYAFEKFKTRLKVSRTYAPHEVGKVIVKPRGRRAQDGEEPPPRKVESRTLAIHVPVMRTREEKKTRLNGILLKLLAKLPIKQPLDVSYLLEAGRRRKKIQS